MWYYQSHHIVMIVGRLIFTNHIFFTKSYNTCIFHCPKPILSQEDLIIFTEWIFYLEFLFKKVHTFHCRIKDEINIFWEKFLDWRHVVKWHWDIIMCTWDFTIFANCKAINISRYRFSWWKLCYFQSIWILYTRNKFRR